MAHVQEHDLHGFVLRHTFGWTVSKQLRHRTCKLLSLSQLKHNQRNQSWISLEL